MSVGGRAVVLVGGPFDGQDIFTVGMKNYIDFSADYPEIPVLSKRKGEKSFRYIETDEKTKTGVLVFKYDPYGPKVYQ